jgi:8-oxo-dGTP pyrophosphatase MutT (NUDIX family)
MKLRKSSGCVVCRKVNGEYEVLIVTSSSGKSWVFPKGGVEPDMTSKDSAVKEVLEEAGVVCRVVATFEDRYRYVKNGVMQVVTMYTARFVQQHDKWLEQDKRLRQWVSIDVALDMVDEYLAPYLMDLKEKLVPEVA